MSVLQTLKLTQKPVISFNAEAQRRQKLIVKLQEQLRLAESALGGNKYMRMRWTTIADADGEPQRVQRAVRMRQWFSKDATGSVLMTVRYGRRLVEFSKGMNAIQVGDMSALTPPWSAPEEELAAEATVDPIEEEIAAQQQTQTLAPFELLSGVSCPAYFPGEQASAASLAFDEHIWSKLSEQLQSQATERLEVCGPFALVQKDLIVSQGCVENECGTNEVQFFLTADNKAAVEIYVDGECTHSSEPGFRYKNLLCAPR
jgi:hypothetical protein